MSERSREANRPSASGIAALASVGVLLAIAAARCLWATDAGWQYAAGEWIAAHGPPRADPFSWAGPARPWIEPRWLWVVAFAKTLDRTGPAGAVLLKTASVLATFGLVSFSLGSRVRSVALAPVLLTAVLASSQRFFVRPEIVSYLLVAVFLWILERDRREGGRAIFLLPLLQVLWANSHTLFALGPVLAVLYAGIAGVDILRRGGGAGPAARRFRRAGTVASLCLAACAVNPWGVSGALFPWTLFREIRGTLFKTAIREFAGPFDVATRYEAVGAYVVLAGLCVLSTLLAGRRTDPFRALVTAIFFWLSTLAIRNIPLFAIVAVPFAVGNFAVSPLARRLERAQAAGAARLLLAGVVITVSAGMSWAIGTDRFYVRQHDTNRFGLGRAPHRYPDRAADFLERTRPEGPVFATMHEASALLARGVGSFIDPRLEVFGEEHFARYLRALEHDPEWRRLVVQYDVRVAVIGLGHTDFMERAIRGGDWNLVFFDETAAVLVRSDVPDAPLAIRSDDDWRRAVADVRAGLPTPTAWEHLGLSGRATSPTPYHLVANFLLTFDRRDDAEPFLRDALAAYPPASRARLTYAAVLDARGDDAGAAREIEEAYRFDPDDPDVASQAGLWALGAGDLPEAARRLERSLRQHADHAPSWAILGEVRLAAGDGAAAESCLARAVSLDRSNAHYRERLAAVRSTRRR